SGSLDGSIVGDRRFARQHRARPGQRVGKRFQVEVVVVVGVVVGGDHFAEDAAGAQAAGQCAQGAAGVGARVADAVVLGGDGPLTDAGLEVARDFHDEAGGFGGGGGSRAGRERGRG